MILKFDGKYISFFIYYKQKQKLNPSLKVVGKFNRLGHRGKNQFVNTYLSGVIIGLPFDQCFLFIYNTNQKYN